MLSHHIRVFLWRVFFWLTLPQLVFWIGEHFFHWKKMRHNRVRDNFSDAKKVLVVQVDEIGDTILSTSFLRELRRCLPDAWITLLIKPGLRNLMQPCPYANEVITFEWQCNGIRALFAPWFRHWRAFNLARTHLWQRSFDLAVVPRFDVDFRHSAYLAYFSGAPIRIGYSETVTQLKACLNRNFDSLYTYCLQSSDIKHEVDRYLDVLGFMGAVIENNKLELWILKDDEIVVDEILNKFLVTSSDMVIGLGPGAREEKRRWPVNRYRQLGQWLAQNYRARIVIVGGPGEEELGKELEKAIDQSINVVGQLTLRQTAALLHRCHLYIGNDTGTMHMAAAVGVPIIEISCHAQTGSLAHINSPVRFGPWGVPHRVLQPKSALYPCTDACYARSAHCIKLVGVGQVQAAAQDMLSFKIEAI